MGDLTPPRETSSHWAACDALRTTNRTVVANRATFQAWFRRRRSTQRHCRRERNPVIQQAAKCGPRHAQLFGRLAHLHCAQIFVQDFIRMSRVVLNHRFSLQTSVAILSPGAVRRLLFHCSLPDAHCGSNAECALSGLRRAFARASAGRSRQDNPVGWPR